MEAVLTQKTATKPSVTVSLKFDPRREEFRKFFMALRQGYLRGGCGICETFTVLVRLCRDEGKEYLSELEYSDVESWVVASGLVGGVFGCEGSCLLLRLYSKIRS